MRGGTIQCRRFAATLAYISRPRTVFIIILAIKPTDMVDPVCLEVFGSMPRQGPGDLAATTRAFAGLKDLPASPTILDAGCGTGAQTFDLASICPAAKIVAADLNQDFINMLRERVIADKGMIGRIKPVCSDMLKLGFIGDKSIDVIWSEGAAYTVGVVKALSVWKRILRDGGGYVVVSDCVWFTKDPPTEIKAVWEKGYPEMKRMEDRAMDVIAAGYELLDSFRLPAESWWKSYYTPMAGQVEKFRTKYKGNAKVQTALDGMVGEIELFRKFSDHFGYAYYIMRKKE